MSEEFNVIETSLIIYKYCIKNVRLFMRNQVFECKMYIQVYPIDQKLLKKSKCFSFKYKTPIADAKQLHCCKSNKIFLK